MINKNFIWIRYGVWYSIKISGFRSGIKGFYKASYIKHNKTFAMRRYKAVCKDGSSTPKSQKEGLIFHFTIKEI